MNHHLLPSIIKVIMFCYMIMLITLITLIV